jgi:D-3-phosphoglycerate dehydrogenase
LRRYGDVEIRGTQKVDMFLKDKEILFIRLRYFWDQDLLRKAPHLKLLCTPTTGVTHIDLKELVRRKIRLVSLQGESKFLRDIHATPEHTFGLALALVRRYRGAFLHERNKSWDRDSYIGDELYGMAAGIIGFGRVGQQLAKYLRSVGAIVLAVDKKPLPCSAMVRGIKKAGNIDELIRRSTIIFLCASYEPENDKLISRSRLDLMRGKYFVNTSRGELIDEEDLIKRIGDNQFAGVAIDVITNETKQNRLEDILAASRNRNVIITPHIAGATRKSMMKTEEYLAQKVAKLIEGAGTWA